MPLNLMYITNRPDVAMIAERSGVDRIFVDMEYIGKRERQMCMNTVQSHHTVDDVKKIRSCLTKSQLLVRINPIHKSTKEYCDSDKEIDEVIKAGCDIIMLPYFKTVEEVSLFLKMVGGRAKTMLLLETPEAVACVDEILALDGIDEMFVGLNDLSLGYGKKFMFELLSDGTVEKLCLKFRMKGVPYGFGGIASIGKGMLPAENVIGEHYRLRSTSAILSRSFCNINLIDDACEIEKVFDSGVKAIREYEEKCNAQISELWKNYDKMRLIVGQIVEG